MRLREVTGELARNYHTTPSGHPTALGGDRAPLLTDPKSGALAAILSTPARVMAQALV